MQIKQTLNERIQAAFASLNLEGPALVQVATRAEFGDYQANGVMAAAKRAKRNPREVAAEVIAQLDVADIAEVDIAGPGFLNITLKPDYLAACDAACVDPVNQPLCHVADYSAPNLAKEMHVGHLRGTVIGDCVTRVLEAQGHTVLRQNHVGDWGTQFGMLITYLDESGQQTDVLADLEDFYRAAKQRFDEDADFKSRARAAVVDLQTGGEHALRQWQQFIAISMAHCQDIYDRLGVTLQAKDFKGESTYNEALPGIIQSLKEQSLLTESDGAQCVFLEEFKSKKGNILPVIVQKSDGGYLYATTDLAAVQFRTTQVAADRVLYFTDARQALHFKQIFAVSKAAGFNVNGASLEHMPFGSMLGSDGKPFKTREGGVVKLADLMDEAISRARKLLLDNNPELAPDEADRVAHIIGIGAIKYAELSKHRTSDYVFEWDQMITFEGNTAPYLQYAYARIQSIFTRGEVDVTTLPTQAVSVDSAERRLAVTIAGFNDILRQVSQEGCPHFLCGYLYELATRFTQFYEACPILKSEAEVRDRRLVFAHQAAQTLKAGLSLLGIDTIDRM